MTQTDQNRARNNEILLALAYGSTSAALAHAHGLNAAQILRIARKRLKELGLQDSLFGGTKPKIRDIHAKGPEILDYLQAHPNS